ncbi:MAG: trehalose-phosphatase [Hyphomonadaceae bacterium]|nr:trehalose-phosphatase [Hyphomonadaceae bacterium]
MTRLPPPPALTGTLALFLDFDGTLAGIQDDPETVALPTGGGDLLSALARQLDGALALVSGRDVRDLSARTPLNVWRAGGHGLEICAPGETPADIRKLAPEALMAAVETATASIPGARVEPKGEVIAVHYRAAPEHGERLGIALGEALSPFETYSLQSGKMVFEAKPSHAHKGRALARMMQQVPFSGRVPVMVGDDTTDEDAMRVAMELGGWAVKVGQGASAAEYGLGGPEEVWTWLRAAAA